MANQHKMEKHMCIIFESFSHCLTFFSLCVKQASKGFPVISVNSLLTRAAVHLTKQAHMALLAAFGWAWSEPNEVTMRLHIEVLLVEWQGIYALWKISPMFPMLHTAQVFAWSLERNTFLLFIQTLTAHFNTLAPEYTLHYCEIEEQTVVSNLIVQKMFLAHFHR